MSSVRVGFIDCRAEEQRQGQAKVSERDVFPPLLRPTLMAACFEFVN